MSAVSKSVIPRSSAFATTARAPGRSTRLPKLLQPRPTAETRRPERPRFRSSTPPSVPREAEAVTSNLVERVDATGKWLVAAEGEYHIHRPYLRPATTWWRSRARRLPRRRSAFLA